VLDEIQSHILSEENVHKYIDLILDRAQPIKTAQSAEEPAVELVIEAVEAKGPTLGGDPGKGAVIPLEECAGRIKSRRQEWEDLLAIGLISRKSPALRQKNYRHRLG
jgi:hypothetical protein